MFSVPKFVTLLFLFLFNIIIVISIKQIVIRVKFLYTKAVVIMGDSKHQSCNEYRLFCAVKL